MILGTEVFKRIVQNKREAAINAVTEALAQTYRFGGFNIKYIRACAEELVDKKLKEIE